MIKYWKKLANTTERRPMSARDALRVPKIMDIIQISTLSGDIGVVDDVLTICMHAIDVEKSTSEAKVNWKRMLSKSVKFFTFI